MIGFSSAPSASSNSGSFLYNSSFPEKRSRVSAEDRYCLRGSDLDSRGQAVQGVQGEEDVRFALEGACPVPQQLTALQVWRDVLHADGLQEVKSSDQTIKSLQLKIRENQLLVILFNFSTTIMFL